MFVCSVRASTVKFFAVIVLTLSVLIGAIAFGSAAVEASASVSVKFSGVKTNEDRLAFIAQCGIEAEGEPSEVKSFTVPDNFDKVLVGYNEIQKSQGLDISKYKNKKVTRYTYEIDGYGEREQKAFVNLIIYRNTVVACDVSSADGGFVDPLVKL